MKSNRSKFSKLLAGLAVSTAAFGNVSPASATNIYMEMNENLERQFVRRATRTTILEKFHEKLKNNLGGRPKFLLNDSCNEATQLEILHTLTLIRGEIMYHVLYLF